MIQSRMVKDNKELAITVADRFDYSVHKDFRDAYRRLKTPGTNVSINLSATKYIDSSALGMLLIAKEHAEGIGGSVILVSPSAAAMKILKMANFDQIFSVA